MSFRTIFGALFLLISALQLLGLLIPAPVLANFTKPALMPTLAAWLLASTPSSPTRARLFFGLLFSTAGDILLMSKGQQSWFLSGLVAFLCAHLCYIMAFSGIASLKNGYLRRHWMALLPVLTFLIVFLLWLIPQLPGPLAGPVTVYALVISAMLSSVINLKNAISRYHWVAMVTGAALFMLSDCMIAINKFAVPFPGAGFAIMLTYLLGQGLLMWGFVNRWE